MKCLLIISLVFFVNCDFINYVYGIEDEPSDTTAVDTAGTVP